jgi:TonB family protein
MTEEGGLASELTGLRVAVAKRKGWHQDSIEILKQTEDPEEAYRLGASHEARLRRASAAQIEHSTSTRWRLLVLVSAVVVGCVLVGSYLFWASRGPSQSADAALDDPGWRELGIVQNSPLEDLPTLPPETTVDIAEEPTLEDLPTLPPETTVDIAEEPTLEDLPTLPPETTVDIAEEPTFTPMTVRPEIRNRSAVIRAMERNYPPFLLERGIGGQALIWLFIDEQGQVANTQIANSSGNFRLDQAALDVASVYEFTPALNGDEVVPVWIQVPITFVVR